jgi:hypothetical protein
VQLSVVGCESMTLEDQPGIVTTEVDVVVLVLE